MERIVVIPCHDLPANFILASSVHVLIQWQITSSAFEYSHIETCYYCVRLMLFSVIRNFYLKHIIKHLNRNNSSPFIIHDGGFELKQYDVTRFHLLFVLSFSPCDIAGLGVNAKSIHFQFHSWKMDMKLSLPNIFRRYFMHNIDRSQK